MASTTTTHHHHSSLRQTDAEEEGEHRGGKKKKMEMLQNDVDHPPDQFLIEEEEEVFSGQISAEILEFCDESDIFPEPIRSPEASSCSGCYGGGGIAKGRDKNPSGYDDVSFSTSDQFSSMDQSTVTALLNAQTIDDNVIPTMDYSSAPSLPPHMMSSFNSLGYNQRDQLEQIMANDAMINGYRTMAGSLSAMPTITFAGEGQLPLPGSPNFQEDFVVSMLPDYLGLDRLLLPPGQGPYLTQMGGGMPMDMLFPQSLMTMPGAGDEVHPENFLTRPGQPDIGGMGFHGLESSQQQMLHGSTNLQMIRENHHPVARGYSSSGSLTPLATEMQTLDDSTFKARKISPEERKQKIDRYLQKKRQRNFNKKIKYACRKTLADSRPRVRGRFAKNDELTDMMRDSDNHEDEDDEAIFVVSATLFSYLLDDSMMIARKQKRLGGLVPPPKVSSILKQKKIVSTYN